VDWVGDHVPGHCGPRQHRRQDYGSAKECEFRHASLLCFGNAKYQARARTEVPALIPKRKFSLPDDGAYSARADPLGVDAAAGTASVALAISSQATASGFVKGARFDELPAHKRPRQAA